MVVGYSVTPASGVGECAFCPGNENLTPKPIREIRGSDGVWAVRCFPAANPIFIIEAEEAKRAEGLYDKMNNVGAHEIIVENRSHTKALSDYTAKDLSYVIDAYRERIRDLKRDKRFKYIQIFRNYGELAGSYLVHPHSHVLATPTMPAGIELELSNAKTHHIRKERCLFCDIIAQEVRQNKRLVSLTTHFVAICPFASRFPYEVWILPRHHDSTFENMGDELMSDFVATLQDTVGRVERLCNAHSIVIHSSPNFAGNSPPEDGAAVADYFHWHIEILPRDFRTSRYKREDQFYVIANTPEGAAASLRSLKI